MFLKLLKTHVRKGVLHVHLPDGSSHTFGGDDKGGGHPEVHWHIHDKQAVGRIARDWEFELGQTYMEGGWDSGETPLRLLLGVLRSNFAATNLDKRPNPLVVMFQRLNAITRSYRNIAHHYDIDEEIFRIFLDEEMFYSCAFFHNETDTLEHAQLNKADIIARKLLLKPGMTVLDIGCGWGSLAFYLAQQYGVHVTGITLSNEQLRVASDEARARNLQDRVQFLLADYREHAGVYDRVVSVGMLEHVGIENFHEYFSRVDAMMKDDGVALIHTIGNKGVPQPTNPWIERYIFPGGRIPSLSEAATSIEKNRLMLTDLEVWRMHYAYTLREWLRRFSLHRDKVVALKGESFYRMWEFYLAACDMSFEFANLVVFHFQLAKRHGVVPLARDYLYGTSAE